MGRVQKNFEEPVFNRIVTILEEARKNVVLSVNFNMVVSYWLVGREIVEEVQKGEQRASYGKQILDQLSKKLTIKYGSGFSVTSLKYFRTFYQVYHDRFPEIGHPAGDLSGILSKGRPLGDLFQLEMPSNEQKSHPENNRVLNAVNCFDNETLFAGFSPKLSWSHYRALMRVKKNDARFFYEKEAIVCSWDKR